MVDVQVDLAHYASIREWKPAVGDWVVWAKWFTQWHGVIVGLNEHTHEIDIIFAAVPFQLFQYTTAERAVNKYTVSVAKMQGARPGNYSVLRYGNQTALWYI